MARLPVRFRDHARRIVAQAQRIEGFMTPREMEFLALLAACPTATGVVLEIGSWAGRSTSILAAAAALAGNERVVAVDPLPCPGAREKLGESLRAAGVWERVEFHQRMSWDLARTWSRPIRLLWIDGDHSLASARRDFLSFSPHLADGAIVAMHDVINPYEGALRVFTEDLLLSAHVGAAGVCGSIGWARYHHDPHESARYRERKLKLYRLLSSLVPLVAFNRTPTGLGKWRYRLARSFVPRRRVDPEAWLEQVG